MTITDLTPHNATRTTRLRRTMPHRMPVTLDDLAPIALDQLNAAAAFLTRVDRKYVLSPDAASNFVGRLPADTRALEIDGRRRFAYASTYYDTAGLDSFFDTAHRRKRRGKVRTRTYLDSGLAFLEVKTKHRGTTVKSRTPWAAPQDLGGSGVGSMHDASARSIETAVLDPAATMFVDEALAAGGVRLEGLRPVLDVTYQRTTLLLPDAAARVTLDSALAWTLASGTSDGWSDGRLRPFAGWGATSDRCGLRPDAGPTATQALPGLVIVETKSGSHPSDADRLLWRTGHRPVSFSKYATGLASLRPELPRNRWHRLLNSPELDAA